MRGGGGGRGGAGGACPVSPLPAGVRDENPLALATPDGVVGVPGVGDKGGTADVGAVCVARLYAQILRQQHAWCVNALSARGRNTVNVPKLEPGVGQCSQRRLRLHLKNRLAGHLSEVGLGHPGDGHPHCRTASASPASAPSGSAKRGLTSSSTRRLPRSSARSPIATKTRETAARSATGRPLPPRRTSTPRRSLSISLAVSSSIAGSRRLTSWIASAKMPPKPPSRTRPKVSS